jgi:hypothetical protein
VSEKPTRIPWIAHNPRDRERMRTLVNAALDEAIAIEERKFAADIAIASHLLNERLGRLDDDEKARRKDRGLAKTREWQEELTLQEAEQGNLEPLRKQYPRLARFINLPKLSKPGKHFKKKPPTDRLTPHDRLKEALFELPRVRAFWKKHYGKTNRPQGQLTAEEIVAERWDLTEKEIYKQRISRKRLKKRASGDR